MSHLDRRAFLKLAAALPTLTALPGAVASAQAAPQPAADRLGPLLPTRPLGRTGLTVTVLAAGGASHHASDDPAPQLIETALAQGCRFFETARMYGGGRVETDWGRHLTPKYRDDIVLLSKSTATNAAGFTRELETSLGQMKTDVIDIYLIHSVNSVQDVDNRVANGVLDAALRAKAQGKIKHVGFSGHRDHRAHDHFIANHADALECVMMPVSVIDTARASFTLNTLPKAVDANLDVFAMKVFGGGGAFGEQVRWSVSDRVQRGATPAALIPDVFTLDQALAFVLSLPIGAATIGCGASRQITQNAQAVRQFAGMSAQQRQALIDRVLDVVNAGPFEHYKA
ncbi:MAG: aldo/keto reductase [Planctomycetota bacterium]